MNIQDRFPLGLTGWISLQSKGLSRVFSNTIFLVLEDVKDPQYIYTMLVLVQMRLNLNRILWRKEMMHYI